MSVDVEDIKSRLINLAQVVDWPSDTCSRAITAIDQLTAERDEARSQIAELVAADVKHCAEIVKLHADLGETRRQRDDLADRINHSLDREDKAIQSTGVIALAAIDKLTAERDELRKTLARLVNAAEIYAADQSHAKDPRCGLVQPITVQEGQQLNDALAEAWSRMGKHQQEVQ